jgi:hypothetical protein
MTSRLLRISVVIGTLVVMVRGAHASPSVDMPSPYLAFRSEYRCLSNTPDYSLWYGCSPTAAGMLMGHYDRNGYGGWSYAGLVPGAIAEPETFVGPATGWSARVNHVIASPGHVDDFYRGGVGAHGDDVNPPQHEFDCLADFMGTSQDQAYNVNGGTFFWFWTDGSPFTWEHAALLGVTGNSGMYGIYEYIDYAGYDTATLYNQLLPDVTDLLWPDMESNALGFTLAQYQSEIDAGRPVLLHLENHTMYGYGYIEGTDMINVYDTWNPGGATMVWGGTYSGLRHYGVTVLELAPSGIPFPPAIPVPPGICLAGIGMGCLRLLRGRRYL